MSDIYSKPMFHVMPVEWAKWGKAANMIPVVALDLPWGRISQTTNIVKSLEIAAPISDIWNIVSDPENLPKYVNSISSVETKSGDSYITRTIIPPSQGKGWSVIESKVDVTEQVDESLRIVSWKQNGFTMTMRTELKPSGKKATVLSLGMEVDGKLADSHALEAQIEQALGGIAKLALGKEHFARKLSSFTKH